MHSSGLDRKSSQFQFSVVSFSLFLRAFFSISSFLKIHTFTTKKGSGWAKIGPRIWIWEGGKVRWVIKSSLICFLQDIFCCAVNFGGNYFFFPWNQKVFFVLLNHRDFTRHKVPHKYFSFLLMPRLFHHFSAFLLFCQRKKIFFLEKKLWCFFFWTILFNLFQIFFFTCETSMAMKNLQSSFVQKCCFFRDRFNSKTWVFRLWKNIT